MAHHYRSDWEWFDSDIDEAATMLEHLTAAVATESGPSPNGFGERLRSALDNDLDAPGALAVLNEMADGILAGGDDPTAHSVLKELGALCGLELDTPAAPIE